MAMEWLQPVDLYCERFGPGLLAEPLNALSNLAFVLAGVWVAARMPLAFAPRPVPLSFNLLAGCIALIGICSGAFHTFATRWAGWLDVLSIALFIYGFAICFARYVLDIRWSLAWIAAPALWALGVFVTAPFESGDLNGSVDYLPALAALSLMTLGLAFRRRPGAAVFALAAALFAVSIALRSVDQAWCSRWVWGTHWAWHLLNAGVLSLAMTGLVLAGRGPIPDIR
ncbi:hypothetical protein [Panacagrimonas sp.]|uniref:hypothetical protein n=1 Tax=Panacagrimonas sp. TaxID=2480088 RepID=UPI003B51F017